MNILLLKIIILLPEEAEQFRVMEVERTQTPMHWDRLVRALRENRLPDWDVYDSVTSSAISPVTEASVANKGKAIDFPDFTKGKWKTRPPINTDLNRCYQQIISNSS